MGDGVPGVMNVCWRTSVNSTASTGRLLTVLSCTGTLGRLVEHKGYSTRIFWNGNMLSIMRRHYHNTLNRELAEMLGVSERSVTRKAREMGLEKDKGFVASLSREHLLLANARSKELGYPGGFTKGMKFRGNQYTGRIRVE